MREIVKLINKKDLEKLIELEANKLQFYKEQDLFILTLICNNSNSIYIQETEHKKELRGDLYFLIRSSEIGVKLSVPSADICIRKDIRKTTPFTVEEAARYVEKTVNELNEEQECFSFIWGDEE